MSLIKDAVFRDGLKTNKYHACNQIIGKAREKLVETNYAVRVADAVTYAIHGTEPPTPPQYLDRDSNIEQILQYTLESRLSEIDDPTVREAVRLSISESLGMRCPTFNYHTLLDGPRQGRVRILTRMIWEVISN